MYLKYLYRPILKEPNMITISNRGSGINATSGTTHTITPSSNCTAGALLILFLVYENSASGGGDPFRSITDSSGNAWVSILNNNNTSGSPSDGTSLRSYSTLQAGGTLGTSSTITIEFLNTVSAFTYVLYEATAGGLLTIVDSGTTTGSGMTPSITSNTIENNNAILSVCGRNSDSLIGDDTDSVNGSWSTGVRQTKTVVTLYQQIHTQHKVVNANGTQTYNPSILVSSKFNLGWIEINEEITAIKSPYFISWVMTSY